MAAANVTRFNEWTTAFELGLSKVYGDKLKKTPKTYTSWLREERAKRFYDTEWSTSGFGIMPERLIGGGFVADQILQGETKRYSLTVYGLALVVQEFVFKWDLYGIFKGLPDKLARTAIDRYNLVAWDTLNKSFVTTDSNYTDYKGEAICDSSHNRMDDAGTWKNRPTDNPGLSYVAIQQAYIDLKKMTDDRGRYAGYFNPQRLITPVETSWIAAEIVGARYRPDNANMLPNQTGVSHSKDADCSPYITSTTAWWIFCSRDDYEIYMRLGDDPDLRMDNDPNTRNRIWTSACSFGMATYRSRGIWGSTGDGATSS